MLQGKSVFIGFLILAALAALVWFVWTWRRFGPGGAESEIARLKKRYARLLGVPPTRAYESLERGLEERLRRDPNRSVEDCLRDMVADLERGRR